MNDWEKTKKGYIPNGNYLLQLLATNQFSKQFERFNKIKDPVLRYSLFLEIIRMVFDLMFDGLDMNIEESISTLMNDTLMSKEEESSKDQHNRNRDLDYLKKSQENIVKLKNELDNYFEGFSDWVQQPIYSPDHSFGYNLMKKDEQDFNNLKKI